MDAIVRILGIAGIDAVDWVDGKSQGTIHTVLGPVDSYLSHMQLAARWTNKNAGRATSRVTWP